MLIKLLPKFVLTISVLLVSCFYTNAQQIDNRKGKAFSEDPFFYQSFIKENNIKSISGTLQVKKEGDIIRNKPDAYFYSFDNQGRLTNYVNTFLVNGKIDSIHYKYTYNSANQIAVYEEYNITFCYKNEFFYDSIGNVKNKVFYKAKRDTSIRWIKIKEEKYEHAVLNDKQHKTKWINNYGRFFKEEITTSNELGYIAETSTRFIISNKSSKLKYNYNDIGYLGSTKYESSFGSKTLKEQLFHYDDLGNLIEIIQKNNGVKKYKRQLLYNESGLMNASLTTDFNSKIINIIKYKYSFY